MKATNDSREHTVVWTIELDAVSPEDAARKALAIQRDPGSWATHFEVRDPGGRVRPVDLGHPADSPETVPLFVFVHMEAGLVRQVSVHSSRARVEDAARDHMADGGTCAAVWECGLVPGPSRLTG